MTKRCAGLLVLFLLARRTYACGQSKHFDPYQKETRLGRVGRFLAEQFVTSRHQCATGSQAPRVAPALLGE